MSLGRRLGCSNEKTIMSKKSVLNGLFSKSGKDSNSESELDTLDCLQQLLDAHLGDNTRLDVEINKFNKLLKIGSQADDVIAQLEVLRALIQRKPVAQVNSPIQDTNWLKNLPANVFVKALLEEPLDASLKVQLKHYLNGLDANQTTSAILVDIINLLEPEDDIKVIEPAPVATTSFDNADIDAIKRPVINLLNNLQQNSDLTEHVSTLLSQAEEVTDNNGLCRLLEETSKLIISSVNNATGQFEHFLLSLKERLDQVDSFINLQSQTNKAIAKCSDQLSDSMNEQVGELKTSITDSDSLEELENHVVKSIEFILSDLQNFNSSRETLEYDSKQQIKNLEEQLKIAKDESESLRNNLQQQRQRAMTDPLTRLPNRQAYDERLQLEYHRWQRYKKPLSLVMSDLDHFKKINDTYGHTCGDYVLQQIADCISSQLRETDFVARFGGEEFVMLLPETNIKEAVIAMNKLRAYIRQLQLQFSGKTFSANMSFGVATFEAKDDYNLVFNRADTALYRAKSRGRNQVCAELKKSV